MQVQSFQQRGNTSLHPVMWIAAIAITAFAVVGIAKLMGWVGTPVAKDTDPLAVAEAPAAVAPAAEAPVAAPKEQAKPAAEAPAKKTVTKTPAKKTETSTGGSDYAQGSGSNTQRVICSDCGTISAIRPVEVDAEGSGVGAVAGGVLGGVVGNQFGKGSGKTAATVAGAVLGGVAGHKAEEKIRSKTVYDVSLRMDDGSSRTIRMEQAPVYGQGQHVRVSGNQLLDAPR